MLLGYTLTTILCAWKSLVGLKIRVHTSSLVAGADDAKLVLRQPTVSGYGMRAKRVLMNLSYNLELLLYPWPLYCMNPQVRRSRVLILSLRQLTKLQNMPSWTHVQCFPHPRRVRPHIWHKGPSLTLCLGLHILDYKRHGNTTPCWKTTTTYPGRIRTLNQLRAEVSERHLF